MPAEFATAVMQGQTKPAEALELWLQQAGSKQSGLAERHTARELTRLADSIAQHGLINPISLRSPRPDEQVPDGIEYLIVTGERRYWAFVYLVNNNIKIHEGNSVIEPARIKELRQFDVSATGNPGQVNYAASKAGMVGLTKSLAYEVASRGITDNCTGEFTIGLSTNLEAAICSRVNMTVLTVIIVDVNDNIRTAMTAGTLA